MERKSIKCVLVGDVGCGKTCLMLSFTNGWESLPEHVPTVFETELVQMTVDGVDVVLGPIDVQCGIDYDRLRPLAYPGTDVFIICFCLADPNSYLSVYERWYPELQHFSPGTPILLAGTKHDLCTHRYTQLANFSNSAPLTHDDGVRLCRDIGAVGFVETSVSTQKGVERVFTEAVRAGLRHLMLY